MSVLVRGMEMPTSCYECEMYEADFYWCSAAKRDIDSFDDFDNRSSFCPLVELPPHGRLIDCDSLEKEICPGCRNYNHRYANCIDCAIANAPTIIPADKGGEG